MKIKDYMKEYIRLLYDTIRYGCNRRMMMRMHREFSGYILEQIKYLIKNIEESTNIPNSVDNEGNVNGTMNRQEWLDILKQIEFSLQYDVNNNKDKLPENIEEVSAYLIKQEQQEKKYKYGLMLLGRYYTDIWG